MTHINFLWKDYEQAQISFDKVVFPWCNIQFHRGFPVVGEIRLWEDTKSDAQRRYLHGVVLAQIAQQVRTQGQQYALPVWKEYFRNKFLGYRTATYVDPITGKKHRRRERISTEHLGLRAYAKYTEQITAYAVTELGVDFIDAIRGDIDPETGEIFYS